MGSYAIIILIIFILITIGGNYLIIKYGQQKIRDDAERKGYSVKLINWNPFHFSLGGRGSQYYHVEYVDEAGVAHGTTCETGLLQGVKWDI